MQFRTTGFCGTSVAHSPFIDNRIVVSASTNFGLVGTGRVYVLDVNRNQLDLVESFETPDAANCVEWSELDQNTMITACGDGKVQLFTLGAPMRPAATFLEHKRDVFSVSWNLVEKQLFCSSSWDGTIKIWDPASSTSLSTLSIPTNEAATLSPDNLGIYQAKFSPHSGGSLASAHADGSAFIWDSRTGSRSLHWAAVSKGDCLTLDWNKYEPNLIATAGVDKLVKVWDLRNPQSPTTVLSGHQYAIKSVRWSPHRANILLSASYDMTVRIWQNSPERRVKTLQTNELAVFSRHTEFVSDAAWALWGEPGLVASTSWDQMVYIWKAL